MKSLSVIFYLLMTMSTLSMAQQIYIDPAKRQSPSAKAESIMNQVFTKLNLNLTDDQTQKITAVWIEHYSSIDKLVENTARSGGDMSSVIESIPKITTDTDKKILALLNNEQKLIYAGVMQRRTSGIQTKPATN